MRAKYFCLKLSQTPDNDWTTIQNMIFDENIFQIYVNKINF